MIAILYDVLAFVVVLLGLRSLPQIYLEAQKYRVVVYNKDEKTEHLRQRMKEVDEELDRFSSHWEKVVSEKVIADVDLEQAKKRLVDISSDFANDATFHVRKAAARIRSAVADDENQEIERENSRLRELLKFESWINGLAFPVTAAGVVEIAKLLLLGTV